MEGAIGLALETRIPSGEGSLQALWLGGGLPGVRIRSAAGGKAGGENRQ
jgi:hypothetical protein